MIGLVMAGGRGTRMNLGEEKLLLVHKKPAVLHVVDALKGSGCFSKIVAATSKHSPKTHRLLAEYGVETVSTEGDGYVQDLQSVLKTLDEPTLVVSGDMPLLDPQMIREIISRHMRESVWQSFVVTKEFLENHGMKAEFSVECDNKECYYTGVSIVHPRRASPHTKETCTILDDRRIALNLNTKYDYDLLKDA